MIPQEKLEAIAAKAEILAGQSLGEHRDALVEMAAQRAMSWCCRSDIPEVMEQAVAALVLTLQEGGESVKSLQRGDTAITYAADGQSSAMAQLAPFRRLAFPEEDPV